MMRSTLSGLIPILATPFDASGKLDRVGLRRLVEFQLDAGVGGVAVFGMASEGFALGTAERPIILRDVADVVAGQVPIVAGVNATSTVGAIEQSREAEEGGAQALMVLPPFMVKPPGGTLVQFYSEVAAATSLSVMVQDAPGVTGVTMMPNTVAELSRIDGVDSVKVEAPPTAPKVGAVADAVDTGQFSIFGGQNALSCLDEYARGAVGTMPACEFSDVLAPVLADWNHGDQTAARAGFLKLLPLILLGLQPGLAWSVHKEVMVSRGLIESAYVRYPAASADAGTRAAVKAVLDTLALPALTPRVLA